MVNLQVVSDLHLEHSSYACDTIVPGSPFLALLGDVGCVSDIGYTSFLDAQLSKFKVVFHVLGNREAYGSSWHTALTKLERHQTANRLKRTSNPTGRLGEYVLLYRGEFEIPHTNITILGCTLFSAIHPRAMKRLGNDLNDFHLIAGWTIEKHCREHKEDLRWLNNRVSGIKAKHPERKIVILTHYSPTVDPKAVDPLHLNNLLKSGFCTDLSDQECWKSRDVVLWAFGHTHFNCNFLDETTGKIVFSNQRGDYTEQSDDYKPGRVIQL